jgi:hypothetical protein
VAVQQVIHSDIDEYSIAYQLASLSEDFAKLPDSRFVDRMDFAAALRQARNIVARRVMRRAEPELFDKTILPYEDGPLLQPSPEPVKPPAPVASPVPS